MNKEITISIEEYKDLIRCKTIVEVNNPTGIIMQTDTDVKFTSLKDDTPIRKQEVHRIDHIDMANFERYGTALKNHCSLCLSTSHRKGFLGLFGERLCDNKECENSKTKFI